MDEQHPLDAGLRARLRDSGLNQSELARQIGRNTGWLNKYISGKGHATIDDIVRIVAVLIGASLGGLSEAETRLVKAYRALENDDQRDDAIALVQMVAKRARRTGLSEPPARTPHPAKHTKHGTR
jgi:hypothetical protein